MNSERLSHELINTCEQFSNCVMMYVYLLSRLAHQLEAYAEKRWGSLGVLVVASCA